VTSVPVLPLKRLSAMRGLVFAVAAL